MELRKTVSSKERTVDGVSIWEACEASELELKLKEETGK